mmetsp:Transcript_38283/g.90538  ORF Transcript_38283/g.90538 Transcript_38283/m.90538 type:complete len:230 (+) Transcript_38283:615-1304(+)
MLLSRTAISPSSATENACIVRERRSARVGRSHSSPTCDPTHMARHNLSNSLHGSTALATFLTLLLMFAASACASTLVPSVCSMQLWKVKTRSSLLSRIGALKPESPPWERWLRQEWRNAIENISGRRRCSLIPSGTTEFKSLTECTKWSRVLLGGSRRILQHVPSMSRVKCPTGSVGSRPTGYPGLVEAEMWEVPKPGALCIIAVRITRKFDRFSPEYDCPPSSKSSMT